MTRFCYKVQYCDIDFEKSGVWSLCACVHVRFLCILEFQIVISYHISSIAGDRTAKSINPSMSRVITSQQEGDTAEQYWTEDARSEEACDKWGGAGGFAGKSGGILQTFYRHIKYETRATTGCCYLGFDTKDVDHESWFLLFVELPSRNPRAWV